MPTFDIKTFASLTGKTSVVNALGTSFGVPSCMLGLGPTLLALLPLPVLTSTRAAIAAGNEAADGVIKKLQKEMRSWMGLTEIDTDNGVFRFISDASELGQDVLGGVAGGINDFMANVNAVAAFGGNLYNNIQSTIAEIEEIQRCIGQFQDYLDFSGGESAKKRALLDPSEFNAILAREYAVTVQNAQSALEFQTSALLAMANIDQVFLDRANDPTLEPDATPVEAPTEEIFRLESGPPLAKKGKFILSLDGLYFDSQLEGLVPALLELESRELTTVNSNEWKLEYDPNLGGRGVPTSVDDLNYYFNTILDPNIVDGSLFLLDYYERDTTLQDMIGQKNRKIYDVSGEIEDLISSGGSQVLIANLRQVMLSETSHYLDKINKRKKQIELAVKLPAIYGTGNSAVAGRVPVNDFSYLQGINFLVDIDKQRQITLNQADVDGVILPLQTKYTQQIESNDPVVLNHLLISRIGKASIIDNAPSSTAPSISINEEISERQLFALYNLLSVTTSDPSSVEYGVFNGADTGSSHNAQLVGDTSSTFTLGLGVPYLKGVANPSNSEVSSVSSMGSYMRLPEQSEFQDFLHYRGGATFETWTHIPEFSAYDLGTDASSLYRLILANENTGLGANASAQEEILNLSRENNLTTVNGMVFGFTRDRRFTKNSLPSNFNVSNSYLDSVLVLAPTQSFNGSSVGFINKREIACASSSQWNGMVATVSSTQGGVSLSSCEDEFCHIVLTLNPTENNIKYYLDGVNIATSSYQDVFGINPVKAMPQIPSVFQENSFRYDSAHVSPNSVEAAKSGPSLDTFFTPWMIGGGYTDGNPDGNFMGGKYGGKSSGLKGHLGGVKMYFRPLTPPEVVTNYNATKNFFKNINVSGF